MTCKKSLVQVQYGPLQKRGQDSFIRGAARYVTDMPRPKRVCPAGEVFHVLNRAVARLTIFEKPDDYEAFLRVLEETWQLVPLPIFAMVVMPNHWHFVVCPEEDDQVTDFFRRLSLTHTMRWHAHYKTGGTGHLYQGRFKSFPVQDDEHLLTVMRYVERNPVRANLAERAEQWQWGSAWARQQKDPTLRTWLAQLTDPPLPRQWCAGRTNRKPRRRLPPSATACGEGALSATINGPAAVRFAWASTPPSAPAADPKKSPDPFFLKGSENGEIAR